MNKLIRMGAYLLFCVCVLPFAIASSDGFTVTSVSLSNILHPGDPQANTQWLIEVALNGGGQSIVGVLDNSTINYQGFTSVYPLRVSGNTDPEEAFYVINNANPYPVYTYSTQVVTGSASSYIIGATVTPAPSCPNSNYEWDVVLSSGFLGLGDDVTVARVCIQQTQIASAANIPATPNIQFSSHFSLSANGKTEKLDLAYDKQSATSSNGLVQANWVGSLVTGNAPPNGADYVAVNNPNSNSWVIQSKNNYDAWNSQYINTKTRLDVSQYTVSPSQNNLPSPCSSIPVATSDEYVQNVASCLNNVAKNMISQNNALATNLLQSGTTIGGHVPDVTNYNGKTALKIPLNEYFVTNPVVVLRVSGSFIGVVIPVGKPKIVSVNSECFNSGDKGTLTAKIQNIGNAQGSFYASIDCAGIDTQSLPKYSVDVGQVEDISIPLYTAGDNQNINQVCTLQVTDYNGGGKDTAQFSLCVKQANTCAPNAQTTNGNLICSCVNVNGVWKQQTNNECTACNYGVISDGKGGWKCANNPAPNTPSKEPDTPTQQCPKGQVYSSESSQCIDPMQLVGYPSDTPCQRGWPAKEGPIVTINERNNACDLFEVKNPQLLSIAQEAATCFATQCGDKSCHGFCSQAYKKSGAEYFQDTNTFKKFAGLYLIYGLGPAAKYMQSYFDAEISCNTAGTGVCTPTGGYNSNAKQLSCRGAVGQPRGWASDTNMAQNSCLFSDLPAHASINVIHTGTCVDYSVALTTLLRYVGYKKDEVFSANAPCHEYNLVNLPEEGWVVVDTVGNSNAPIGDNWQWTCQDRRIAHCDFQPSRCANDNGHTTCPARAEVRGC